MGEERLPDQHSLRGAGGESSPLFGFPLGNERTNVRQSILRASLDHNSLSIDKFSRWLRALCTIMIARNDRLKAIGYVEQAVGVIKGSVGSDEVNVLLWVFFSFHGAVTLPPLRSLTPWTSVSGC